MSEPGFAERRTVDGELIERIARPALAVQHGLEPHPEGGWYGSSWRSTTTVEVAGGTRPTASVILFLLPAGEFSAWHTVTSSEVWIWGGLGEIALQLGGDGATPSPGDVLRVGPAAPHAVVPPGVWQRTLVSEIDALATCVVSPGFDFADFALEPDA